MKTPVNFFKPSGKWYTREEVDWFYFGNTPAHFDAVITAHCAGRLAGMTAVSDGPNPLGFPQLAVVPS